MTKLGDPNWSPEYQKFWRQARNRAIRRLARETKLTPTQITRLYHNDLYRDNRPVEIFTVPDRIAKGGKIYKVKLSEKLRENLMLLNLQPFLIIAFPHVRAAFSSRTQGAPLSPRQVKRIVTEPLKAD